MNIFSRIIAKCKNDGFVKAVKDYTKALFDKMKIQEALLSIEKCLPIKKNIVLECESDMDDNPRAFYEYLLKIGYNKVYKTLKQGGVFARFANHPYPCKDEPELHMEIEAAYEKYYDTYYDRKSKKPAVYTEEDARERAYIAEKYGFTEITYAVFSRIREFTASEYIELLGTYSDHIAIEEPIRSAFFKEIEDAINHHGGILKLYDTIDLQMAMVPDI